MTPLARARRRLALPLGGAVILAGTLVASSSPAAGAPAGFATRAHPPTGLRITVPAPYRMGFRKGVYILNAPGRTLTFSRSVTSVGADTYVKALLGQVGGTVLFTAGGPAESAAVVDLGGRKQAVVVERRGGRLTVTTSTSRVSDPLRLEVIRAIGRSARGGVALRASQQGVGKPVAPIALRQFRASDGGAVALVPAGSRWDIQDGGGGVVGGSSPEGAFVFGLSMNVIPPGVAPGPLPPTIQVAPYMDAATALAQFVPQISPGVANVRIRQVLRDAVFPTFSSSAMYLFDYTLNGRPWTGAAVVATDDPSKYSGLAWGFYYSGVGVPAGGSPAVGQGLLRAWRSWNPSGAIALRTSRQLQLISETNQVWQQTAEFRAVTADRQARDVGCLLLGYNFVEDNSRRFQLPPLPCGQVYVERS